MGSGIRVKEVHHICLVVGNIKEAIERIARSFETPKIKMTESASMARLEGKDVGKYQLKAAVVKLANNLTIELLEIAEGRSVEQDWLRRHGSTIHHIAIVTENLEEEASKWVRKEIKILQEDHGMLVYLDTENILGMNVELVHPRAIESWDKP